MISKSNHTFFANIKTSPLSEGFRQLSPLNVNGDDLKILELSNYSAGPGSVESARSSGTDQSSDNLSVVHISHFKSLSLPLNKLGSRSSTDQQDFNSDLTCAVCGDTASGIHYSVISCNGCKTYFRRTYTSGRKFVCKANGQCLFDKNKRCSCRACRWQKCVEVGMNPQAIQHTPSANLTLSIARKRFQRSLRNPPARLNIQSLQTEQEIVLHCIDQVLHLDEKYDRLRCSSFINYDSNLRLADLLNQPSRLGDANKYPLVEKWAPRPKSMKFIEDFSKLKELGIKFWFYMDLYLSVEYIKTLPIFHQLKTQDKYALLFDTALKDLNMANAYYSYTKRAEEIVYPDDTSPFMQKENLFELEKLVRRGIVPEMCDLKPDQIQFSLMRAVCALDCTCIELSEEGQELIANQCSKYTTALLNYLQNKHGIQVGTRRFSESMSFLAMIVRKIKNNYDYYAFKTFILRIPIPSALFHEIMTKRISIKPSE